LLCIMGGRQEDSQHVSKSNNNGMIPMHRFLIVIKKSQKKNYFCIVSGTHGMQSD
jgi:hypothetical protein